MQDSQPEALAPLEAPPYGLLGLIFGTVAIGLLSALLCGAAVAGVCAGASAFLGWHETLARLNALRAEAGADPRFLLRAGIVISLVAYAAVAIAVALVARFRAKARWRDIIALHAWNPFRGKRLFWFAAVAGVLYNLGVSALISFYYPASKDWIQTPTDPIWIVAFVVLAAIFAPIAEEFVFRGWLFTSLKRSFGAIAALAVTSVLFALAHWESTHLYALAVLPVGLVLGLIREKTGSIVATIMFHAFYNGAASVLLLFGR